jgi:hypothetical protein
MQDPCKHTDCDRKSETRWTELRSWSLRIIRISSPDPSRRPLPRPTVSSPRHMVPSPAPAKSPIVRRGYSSASNISLNRHSVSSKNDRRVRYRKPLCHLVCISVNLRLHKWSPLYNSLLSIWLLIFNNERNILISQVSR